MAARHDGSSVTSQAMASASRTGLRGRVHQAVLSPGQQGHGGAPLAQSGGDASGRDRSMHRRRQFSWWVVLSSTSAAIAAPGRSPTSERRYMIAQEVTTGSFPARGPSTSGPGRRGPSPPPRSGSAAGPRPGRCGPPTGPAQSRGRSGCRSRRPGGGRWCGGCRTGRPRGSGGRRGCPRRSAAGWRSRPGRPARGARRRG